MRSHFKFHTDHMLRISHTNTYLGWNTSIKSSKNLFIVLFLLYLMTDGRKTSTAMKLNNFVFNTFQVLLLSSPVVRYFLYLVIYRGGDGQWFIYVKSMANKELTKDIQVLNTTTTVFY
jgi:hypothetical protein